MQQITNFSGDRPFNHPRLASAGDYVVVNFASTLDEPDTTNQYVMVIDSTGKPVTTPLDVGLNDGNNHGAAEMHFLTKDTNGVDHFLGGFLHNNNESYAFGLSVSKDASGNYQVNRDWLTEFVRPANIGRPTCAVTGATSATCCAAKGNNRPPEIGVQCAVLDTTTGNIVNKVLVAPSNPNQKVYMNQPTIASLGNGMCAIGVVMSDGQGRNGNGHFLGSNTSMAYTVDCNTLQVKNTQSAIAPFQRHAVLTSSLFGNQGQTFIGSLGCSSTGAGGAGLQLINVDANGMMSARQGQQHDASHVAVRYRMALLQGTSQSEQSRPRLPPHTRQRPQPGLPGPQRMDARGIALRHHSRSFGEGRDVDPQ